MEHVLLALLLAQAVIGGADTLLNHELLARLPHRREARPELVLHALREANYGVLFVGLGLFAWNGAAAWIVAALVAAEVLITAVDEYLENRIRVLPQNERVMHVFLTLNLGLIIATLVPLVREWSARPTGWAWQPHGAASVALAAFGAASWAWSVRDATAVARLRTPSGAAARDTLRSASPPT